MLKDKLGTKISVETSYIWKFYYTSFPNVWLKNNTVNIEELDDCMLPVIAALNSLGSQNNVYFMITSGKDSTHSTSNSYHYVGKAVDISFRSAITETAIPDWANQGEIFQSLKRVLNPEAPNETNFDIVWEKDHIHVEYDPHKLSVIAQTSTPVKTTEEATGSVSSQQTPEEQLIPYLHTDPSIGNLSALIDQNPLFKDVKESELESLVGEDGLTNRQRIENTYNNPDSDANGKEQWPLLKPGTIIYVKPSSLVLDSLSMESVHQVKKFQEWGEYQSATQYALSRLDYYRPAYWGKANKYEYKYPVKYINSFFQVWIFSKARNEVLNVTNYCSLVRYRTHFSNNDSFSLSLSFIHSISKEKKYNNVFSSDAFNGMGGKNAKVGLISSFAKDISENDIVFISMEQLACEKYRSKDEEVIGLDCLANQFYDFIGLVSSVNQTSDAQGRGVVQIEGESLSKIFNVDEAIFRPIAAIADSFGGDIIIGDRKKRGFMQRMFVDGQYYSMFSQSLRTIGNTMKFYMNTVSNIGLLPLNDVGNQETDLFFSWGKDRT